MYIYTSMRRSPIQPLILTLLLAALFLSPTILSARGVTTYSPGVAAGQWALYRQLSCHAIDPTLCTSHISGLDYAIFDVTSVYSTQVTLNLILVYPDGT